MWHLILVLLYPTLANSFDFSDITGGEKITTRKIVEDTIAYFQRPDPYGIPVVSIPEPLELKDPILLQSITLSNVSVTGHSKMRLKHFLVDLERFEAKARVQIPKLEVTADYLWPGYWSDSVGKLNLTFIKMGIGMTVNLMVDIDGTLQIHELTPSLDKDDFLLEMTDLNTAHQLLVFAGNTFFDTIILPFVQKMVQSEVISEVNPMLKEKLAEKKLPVDILPVDYFIAKLKKSIANDQNIDPLLIPEMKVKTSLPVSMEFHNITVQGLSSIHRRGQLTSEIVDDKLFFRVLLGTNEVKISGEYSVYSSIIYITSGNFEFAIEEIEVYIHVHQPVNIRYSPTLRKIDIKLGNFILMTPGDKNIQYLIEFSVNLLPNIFRNSLLDKKIESVVKEKIQIEFGLLELDKLVDEALDNFLPEDSKWL